jgi:membrane protein implicated in regulation of membrane protease activity
MLGTQAANGSWEGLTVVFALLVLMLALLLVRMRNR